MVKSVRFGTAVIGGEALESSRRDLMAETIEKELNIPPFPAVAQRVLAELNKPETTAGLLSELIIKDQGLTTSILKMVNSSFYGLRVKMESVNHAVAFLGMKAVRWLIVSAASKMIYQRFGKRGEELWTHSLGAALAARLLSVASSSVNSEEAFLAGLLHDVGKVVMHNEAPDQFEKSVNMANAESLESCQAEMTIFGFTHADVGSLLIQRWRLSRNLDDAVYLHHDLELAETEAQQALPLIWTVSLADRICHHLAIGTNWPLEGIDFDREPAVAKLGIEREWLDTMIDQIRSTYEQERALFG